MNIMDAEVAVFTNSLDGRFAIAELTAPVDVKCEECEEKHHTTSVVLIDRAMNAVIPVDSVQEAKYRVFWIAEQCKLRASDEALAVAQPADPPGWQE